MAEPGSTYVTEETFKLTEGLFRFEALGEKEVKGKEEPVKVYRVIAPSTMKTRFDVSAERGLTPFVGRERELELLLDGFERCKSGRGQAFSIMAEAGVGKSRLLYEFRKAVTNEDVTFLEGKCLSYSRGVAYHPMIDILKSNFNILDSDRDDTIRGKVRAGLKILEADDDTTRPYLSELLSAKNGGIDKAALGPEMMKIRITEALKLFVLKGSQIRPLIMAVEDLHWIDKSSEEHLKGLLDHISGARVFLIFTYRPEFVHTWGGKSYHSQVNLNRLSNRESLTMLAHQLGTDDIDGNLEELVLNKTEGIPFFIEEFVKSLRDLRVIDRENNTYCLIKDIQTVSIPAKIQDVIMARVDALPEGAKGLLQTGSVVGRELSHELIKQVAELTQEELMSYLSVLKDSELLYERGIYPRSTYIFKHALTQEVTYDSMLQKQRKKVHGKIGKAIEDLYSERIEENYEMLAYHYERSDNNNKALEYLNLTNQKAIQVCAMVEAKAYFEKIMDLLDGLSESAEHKERRISLLVRQGPVFELLLKYPEYFALLIRYEPTAVELGNQGLLGRLYASLGNCEYWFGKLGKSIQTFTKAIELCETPGNAEYALDAYRNLLWSCWFLGDFNLNLTFGEKALKILDSNFDPLKYVHMVSVTSFAYSFLGRWDRAVEESQKARSIAEEYSNNSLISFTLFSIAVAYIQKGDLAQAVKYGKLSVEKASTPADCVYSQSFLAWALCRAGELKKGIDLLIQVVSVFQAARLLPAEIMVRIFLGEAYWLAREFEKSKQTLKGILDLAERLNMKPWTGFAHRILGEIAIKTTPDKAVAHFDKSLSIYTMIGAENDLALTYVGYGRLHRHKGNIAEARKYFEKALGIFEHLGTLTEPEKVRKDLADLPGD
jgi:tetratricopeptide (TPR) repeat protein